MSHQHDKPQVIPPAEHSEPREKAREAAEHRVTIYGAMAGAACFFVGNYITPDVPGGVIGGALGAGLGAALATAINSKLRQRQRCSAPEPQATVTQPHAPEPSPAASAPQPTSNRSLRPWAVIRDTIILCILTAIVGAIAPPSCQRFGV